MMIYEDQDLGGSSNEGDNKLSAPLNDENFFSIKLNDVSLIINCNLMKIF